MKAVPRLSSVQVGGEGDERSPAKAPHPRPLSPEYRGEGRIICSGSPKIDGPDMPFARGVSAR